jgi:hypothetical protein
MKITRIMMFVANLARVIPVNPIMLVDVMHHPTSPDAASATAERSRSTDAAQDRVIEACVPKNLQTQKS